MKGDSSSFDTMKKIQRTLIEVFFSVGHSINSQFFILIKAMADKGEKMPVTQTYRPNLQIYVVLVC